MPSVTKYASFPLFKLQTDLPLQAPDSGIHCIQNLILNEINKMSQMPCRTSGHAARGGIKKLEFLWPLSTKGEPPSPFVYGGKIGLGNSPAAEIVVVGIPNSAWWIPAEMKVCGPVRGRDSNFHVHFGSLDGLDRDCLVWFAIASHEDCQFKHQIQSPGSSFCWPIVT